SFRSLLPSSPRLTPFPYTTLFRSNRRNPRIERRRDILRDVHIRTIDDRFGVEDQRDAVAVDHLLQRCAVLGRDLFHDVNPRTLHWRLDLPDLLIDPLDLLHHRGVILLRGS